MQVFNFLPLLEADGFTVQIEGENLRVKPSAKITNEIRCFIRAFKNRILAELKQQAQASNCPVCTCDVAIQERTALIARFCPLGCPFVQYTLKPESDFVTDQMLEDASLAEVEAMLDSLDEREAILLAEGFSSEVAKKKAELDLLLVWLNDYERRIRNSFPI